MDEEDFVQFTICVLDKFHRSNSVEFTRAFNEKKKEFVRQKKDDAVKEKIAQNMGRVGDGVLSLSYVTMQREIETWESTAFNLTDKLYDMEEEEQTDRVVQKMSNLKKRLLSLDEKISESKKRCAKLDDNKTN